jgi:alcohol dehydrogenase
MAMAPSTDATIRAARVVSHVLDWEQLPAELPEKRLKPVFVRADG